jgi:hypothetical protein
MEANVQKIETFIPLLPTLSRLIHTLVPINISAGLRHLYEHRNIIPIYKYVESVIRLLFIRILLLLLFGCCVSTQTSKN